MVHIFINGHNYYYNLMPLCFPWLGNGQIPKSQRVARSQPQVGHLKAYFSVLAEFPIL